MQRIPIVFVVCVILVILYYFTPLRSTIDSQFNPAGQSTSQQKAKEDEPFDKVSIDLLVISDKMANLEGKVRLLALAQEHPDWFDPKVFAKLPELIAKTDKELADAKTEYERIKIQYARETVTKMLTAPAQGEAAPGPAAQ